MTSEREPFEIEIVSDQLVGEDGFLHLRRMRLRNLRPDGSRSAVYLCDFVERRKGIDAVVLVLWRRGPSGVEALLREGLRIPVIKGRPAERVPMPEPARRLLFTEVVAGIIEEGEVGEEAIRKRAADEAWEEAGVRVDPARIELLGSSFPSPGLTAERFFFAACELLADETIHPAEGDGSPMEEGSSIRFVPLDEAIAMCARGEIEDAKTEIILRRLRDRLAP